MTPSGKCCVQSSKGKGSDETSLPPSSLVIGQQGSYAPVVASGQTGGHSAHCLPRCGLHPYAVVGPAVACPSDVRISPASLSAIFLGIVWSLLIFVPTSERRNRQREREKRRERARDNQKGRGGGKLHILCLSSSKGISARRWPNVNVSHDKE